jgi:hypothetical protein
MRIHTGIAGKSLLKVPVLVRTDTYGQCCGSGMFSPDPGSCFLPSQILFSPIPDPTTLKKGGDCGITFFSRKFHKIENYFIFVQAQKKKVELIYKELKYFYHCYPTKLRVWDRNLGFGKTCPGSRCQKSTRSAILWIGIYCSA